MATEPDALLKDALVALDAAAAAIRAIYPPRPLADQREMTSAFIAAHDRVRPRLVAALAAKDGG